MALTNFSRLTNEQLTIWARDTWRHARNMSMTNQFLGSGPNSMIQRITELKKDKKGARAVITLVADLEGDGIAGDRQLEGNEEAITSADQVIRVDQLRHANKHEGKMADQKSVVEYRENSKDVLAYWLSDRIDQMTFLTLSGFSYSLKTNGAARVGSDLPFLEYAADVTASTSNRRTRWDATSGLVTSASTDDVIAADTIKWQTLVDLKAYAKEQYVRGIREKGGEEVYHVFLTPTGMAQLKMDDDYMANLRNAGPRGGSNALFTGNSVKVDGLYIHEFRHVYNTKGATSGVDKWGGSNDIEGQAMLFCGAQAMGFADIGDAEWHEKGFDYDNQQGISYGKICGMLKPQFTTQYAANTVQDFGVLVCYTAL